MAERVGFEPTLPVKVNTLSKRAPSATRPSLRRATRIAFARRFLDGPTAAEELLSCRQGLVNVLSTGYTRLRNSRLRRIDA
jgi:hypothetical protein